MASFNSTHFFPILPKIMFQHPTPSELNDMYGTTNKSRNNVLVLFYSQLFHVKQSVDTMGGYHEEYIDHYFNMVGHLMNNRIAPFSDILVVNDGDEGNSNNECIECTLDTILHPSLVESMRNWANIYGSDHIHTLYVNTAQNKENKFARHIKQIVHNKNIYITGLISFTPRQSKGFLLFRAYITAITKSIQIILPFGGTKLETSIVEYTEFKQFGIDTDPSVLPNKTTMINDQIRANELYSSFGIIVYNPQQCTKQFDHESGSMIMHKYGDNVECFARNLVGLLTDDQADPFFKLHRLISEPKRTSNAMGAYFKPAPDLNPINTHPKLVRGLGTLPRWGPNQFGCLLRYATVDNTIHFVICSSPDGTFTVPTIICQNGETAVEAITNNYATSCNQKSNNTKWKKRLWGNDDTLKNLFWRGYFPIPHNTMDAWAEASYFTSCGTLKEIQQDASNSGGLLVIMNQEEIQQGIDNANEYDKTKKCRVFYGNSKEILLEFTKNVLCKSQFLKC